jgi:ferrous iron transport protein A
VEIVEVAVAEAVTRRLAELGVRPGRQVTVIHRVAGGGRLVGSDESRIALDRGTARRIEVRATTSREPARS